MDNGVRLDQFPRPNVAVDIAVLTVARPPGTDSDESLCVVVQRGTDNRAALPGRFIRERESVEQTVTAVLTQKLGMSLPPLRLRLLRVFDDPDRDPRGWTLSIAYSIGVPAPAVGELNGELAAIAPDGSLASGEHLLYDHDQIVGESVRRMRERYERGPDPDGLLQPPFALSELRRIHEAVLGAPLRKDTFSRRMRDRLLQETDAAGSPLTRSDVVGRPAQMFSHTFEPQAVEGEPFPLPRAHDPGRAPAPRRRPPS